MTMTTTTSGTRSTVRLAPTIVALVAGLAVGAGSTMLAERGEANPSSPVTRLVIVSAAEPGVITDVKDHPRYGRVIRSDQAATVGAVDVKDHPRYGQVTATFDSATVAVADVKDHPRYRRTAGD